MWNSIQNKHDIHQNRHGERELGGKGVCHGICAIMKGTKCSGNAFLLFLHDIKLNHREQMENKKNEAVHKRH